MVVEVLFMAIFLVKPFIGFFSRIRYSVNLFDDLSWLLLLSASFMERDVIVLEIERTTN